VLSLEPGFAHLDIDSTVFPFTGQVDRWQQENMFFGGVHAVALDPSGTLAGAGDRRRGGAVKLI
jgi:gamma-glutamyltranspeptidase/glutathione hydrolase